MVGSQLWQRGLEEAGRLRGSYLHARQSAANLPSSAWKLLQDMPAVTVLILVGLGVVIAWLVSNLLSSRLSSQSLDDLGIPLLRSTGTEIKVDFPQLLQEGAKEVHGPPSPLQPSCAMH